MKPNHALDRTLQVFDYVDQHAPDLARMYAKRLKGYRSMGYSIESWFAPSVRITRATQ